MEENNVMFCSNEELQEYIASDGNRIIWFIIHKYAKGLDPDDAYQEAFIGVAKALATYREDQVKTKKSTYVYQVVYNQIKMLLRARATNKRAFERESASADELVNLRDPSISMEDEVIDRITQEERARTLYEAINAGNLTKDERTVILMMLREAKQIDIGEAIGSSQGHVSKLRKSAIGKIKAYLVASGWDGISTYYTMPATA